MKVVENLRGDFILIVKIQSQNAAQPPLLEDQDVVEALAPDRANQPFHVGTTDVGERQACTIL